ncbi:1757_t:CDS:2 [Funneliformis caledonium]|uniref:1757_t:CDS:1 n=1 Tax=Funneliformis caledonium TaxID=1117310 RepID=A0A9N9BS27_9GLOM|nr:1757_t:CDS:2 [Funneliformis caledonium]
MAILKMKKPLVYIILVLVYLLGLAVTITCLVFAIEKRKAFMDNGDEIVFKNEAIENLYLFLLIATIISYLTSMCCSIASNEPNILGDGGTALVQFITSLVWIIIPAVYTVLTTNELEKIPFSCSTSSSNRLLILHACKMRRNNLLLMWIDSVIMFLTMFTLCFCFYGLEIRDEEDILIDQSLGIGQSSEVSTPPVLKRFNPYFCKH